MWNHLADLDYNPVKLRSEFLLYHASAVIPLRPVLDLDSIKDEYSLLGQAFEKGNGIIFGEEHFDNVSAGYLIDNMEYLASLGVDTLFFEGLFFGLEHGVDGKREIRDSVHPEYSRLMESAQKNGLQIIGIDSKGCKRGDGVTRDIFMNAHASAIINATRKRKWIALTGMMHLTSGNFIDSVTLKKNKVHGLAELTGATSIIVHAIENHEYKYIKYKTPFLAWPAKRITPDFIVGIYSYKHVLDSFRGKRIINPVEELYQFVKHDSWEISHYDIDTYAKFCLKSGYVRGAVFSFTNSNINQETLLAMKNKLEASYSTFSDEITSWFNVSIDYNELIFLCNFESIEYAAEAAKESLLNKELLKKELLAEHNPL
jgi:hypothetical protein